MQNKWPTKKLEDIVDILDKFRKPVTRRDRIPGPYPYYGATGLQDYVAEYIFDEDLILLGEDGANWGAGDHSAYKIDGKCWVNNHAHVLRSYKDIVLDDWLVFFLNISDLSEYITGTTVKKLNQEKLRSIEIPLPPIEEQRKIVKKIEELFVGIDEAQKLREEAQQDSAALLPAAFHHIFSQGKEKGWSEEKIDEVVDSVQYGYTASAKENGQAKLLRITDIQNNNVSWSTVPYCDCEDIDKYLLHNGDIVFARTGATVGKSYLIKNPPDNSIFASYLIRMQIDKKKCYPQFLHYFFQSPNYWDQITEQQVGGAQPNVNSTKLKKIFLFLPPLTEQKKIIECLDHLSEKVKALQKLQTETAADFSDLKQSILHKAFSGELLTQGEGIEAIAAT